MRAWPSPEVPSLADHGFGDGGPVRVHDTASGELLELDPPVRARMYVCGITPYDATHMGHAATYLTFDLLQRVWRDRGRDVAYVQNVTDVDEPLLERAAATGVDWAELAERETALFREDMTALAVIAPEHYMGAVETIDLAVGLVGRLRAAGAAYQVEDDLYFSVHADPTFGAVSHLDAEAMLRLSAANGGDPDRPGKRDPLDCLLWRAERPGEPAWDSPFGRGRPGWHVECSAMALHFLGETIDVQGGGSDLVFPHHEMSASQAQVATKGAPFATAYVHAGMVAYMGEKMSKSKGNLVLVSDLRRAGREPMAIRLALLAHHYRSDWEWADGPDGDLERAEQRLARWRDAFGRDAGAQGDPVVNDVRAALTDDLDAPRAVAAIDAWADSTLGASGDDAGAIEPAAPAAVALVAHALLGIS